MPTLPDLFERLAEYGEVAGADTVIDRAVAAAQAAPVTELTDRRPARPIRAIAVAAAIVAVVAVVIPVVVARSGHGDRRPVVGTTAAPQPAPSTKGVVVPPASAAQLGSFRWSTIAAAPIRLGDDQASVWDGSEVLVYGEDFTHADPHGVGAAYDPATNRWRRLPTAPLEQSFAFTPAAVWTGNELIVLATDEGLAAAPRGEAYDPSTNRWRTIARPPLCSVREPAVVWTGTDVVVAGGVNIAGSGCPTEVATRVAAYNPTTNRWRSLPALPIGATEQLLGTRAVWADGRIVALVAWQHAGASLPRTTVTTPAGQGGALISPVEPHGVRVYALPAGATRWKSVGEGGTALADLYSSGPRVVVSPGAPFCGDGVDLACTSITRVNGVVLDLARGTAQTLVLDAPARSQVSDTASTGMALVAFTTADPTLDCVVAGCTDESATAWDVSSGRSVALARPPFAESGRPRAVWTGRELLVFASPALSHGPNAVAGFRLGP